MTADAFAPRLLERGVDIITGKDLLARSTVTVTMRYTHSNLDSKIAAIAKLPTGNCHNPATPVHQIAAVATESVTNSPLTRRVR